MRMSKSTYDNMNKLVAKCFNANAVFDNLAYSLDYHYYSNIAEIVHHNVAHIMPQWADLATEEMLKLSARPVRLDIQGYSKDYDNLPEVFGVLSETLLDIREDVKGLIEDAEISGDDEVKLFGEDFLMIVQNFIKQADEWVDAAHKLNANDLNIHIKDYTHFIKL